MKKAENSSAQTIIALLMSEQSQENIAGMKRFAAGGAHTLGIAMPRLRVLAKEIGKDHETALELWESGIHEARILASLVEKPQFVTPAQADAWVKDFDSWDICDQVCINLFKKLPFATTKVHEWANRKEPFVKRSAFALIACLCHGNKHIEDAYFASFFPLIRAAATDDRNFVKKAVNWALRQIGKRNKNLNLLAQEEALELMQIESKPAVWIGKNALQELQKKLTQ